LSLLDSYDLEHLKCIIDSFILANGSKEMFNRMMKRISGLKH